MTASASFDDLAGTYAEFRTGYSADLYEALAESGIRAPLRVLDLACGTGIVTRELARRGCETVGLDLSEPMLERAREALADLPGVSFVVGRAEALPFGDASFDALTCAQAFHWFDRAKALAEVARVVRPAGTVAVWWKTLMRGDAMWLIREEAARNAGVEPTRDVIEGGFPEFEAAGALRDQRLRVIPWIVEMPVEQFIGYERSRGRAKMAYGERLGAYLAALESALRARRDPLQLNYIQYLFLANVRAEEEFVSGEGR